MAAPTSNTYSGALLSSKAPNLPISPTEYTQQYQDQVLNALRLYFNQVDNFTQSAGSSLALLVNKNLDYLEAYDRSASIALTTTPTLLQPASFLPANTTGITYDPTTGIFTFLYAGTYSLSISLNIATTTANQHVYVYAQKNTGSGWVNNSNSGKEYDLVNNTTVQFVSPQSVYRVAGEQTRYYIWSDGTTSSLVTQTLPTVTPSVYVPAIRIQYAG